MPEALHRPIYITLCRRRRMISPVLLTRRCRHAAGKCVFSSSIGCPSSARVQWTPYYCRSALADVLSIRASRLFKTAPKHSLHCAEALNFFPVQPAHPVLPQGNTKVEQCPDFGYIKRPALGRCSLQTAHSTHANIFDGHLASRLCADMAGNHDAHICCNICAMDVPL